MTLNYCLAVLLSFAPMGWHHNPNNYLGVMMLRNSLVVAIVIVLSACVSKQNEKKQEVRHPAYIPNDGVYMCVYDIAPDRGPSLLTNNVRVKRPPTAVLAIKKINDGKIAARLQLDTMAVYEGYNLERLRPKSGGTTYEQSPTPSDMENSYYFLSVAYATDENMNMVGVSAFYQDVSAPASIIARCVEPSKFKEMVQKPHFGWYR